MYCNKCGAEIDDQAVVCVKCGCAVGNVVKTQSNDGKTNSASVTSFIISLVCLFFCWTGFLSVMGGVASVILAIIGLKKTSTSDEKGKGFAITGLILGIILLAIGIPILIGSIVGLSLGVSALEQLIYQI